MAYRKKTGGRQRGSVNKVTAKAAEAIAESGLTPKDYLLSVMRDESVPRPERMSAAKDIAPYCHHRLTAIEHGGKNGEAIKIHLTAVDARL